MTLKQEDKERIKIGSVSQQALCNLLVERRNIPIVRNLHKKEQMNSTAVRITPLSNKNNHE